MIDSTHIRALSESYPVVFYDGECLLCNRSIQWIIKNDTKDRFRFSTLDKLVSNEVRILEGVPIPDSIIVMDKGKMYFQSEAVLLILSKMAMPYKLLSMLSNIIPLSVRNKMYQLIAKYRYRWFGKADSCILPPKDWASKFI